MPRGKQQPRRTSSGPKAPPVPPSGLSASPPSPATMRAFRTAAVCAALLLLTFIAFQSVLSSRFTTFDDPYYVSSNPQVQKGLTWESVRWAFTTHETANWHPVTWLSHMLDVRLFGMNPGLHHLTSLLLHALNAVLLFLLLFRMTGALWRSAFAAALFALHPLHVESVAWIAERKDVLSTLFWLLTTGAWLAYVKSKKPAPYGLMLAFFALGLMAKPMLVTLPFTLLLLDFWPLRRLAFPLRGHSDDLKKLLWEKAPLFAMAAASGVVTIIAQRSGGAVAALSELPLGERAANAARSYAAYLGKAMWPSPLAAFYPHPHAGVRTLTVIAALLALAGITAAAVLLKKKAPYLPMGWLWYLGTLVPVIGLMQVGEQAMADRYTYVPLIGIFIAAAWGLGALADGWGKGRVAAVAAALSALSALAIMTRIQAAYWTDSITLFEHALKVTPENALAQSNLGVALSLQGRMQEAIPHLQESLRIAPGYPNVHISLGNALSATGRAEEAAAEYAEALKVKPDDVMALTNLGMTLGMLNRLPEAVERLREAVRLEPGNIEARLNLGTALDRMNRLPEALEQFQEALRLKPDGARILDNLGLALGKMNRLPEAVERFQQAARVQPDSAEIRFHLGIALSRLHRLREAGEQFQNALEINPDFEPARASLENVRRAMASGR
jgi:protein O-mannosyl-transferase